MSAILRLFVFLLGTLVAWAQPLPGDCRQLVLVVSKDWNTSTAGLQRYERKAERWTPVGTAIPVVLGRTGLAWGLGEAPAPLTGPQKKEGDNRAPAGVYKITQLWLRKGIAPPPPGGFPAQRIQSDTIGVDDPQSRYYNRILRTSQVQDQDWDSWEKMDISDYDRVLVVSHNLEQPTPGRGSCIFIHRWETSTRPTSGCTAMDQKNLIRLIDWLKPGANPRLVQLPKAEASAWRESQGIPASTK
ncbi:MAG: L,D-transpeptidase family protein [Candidatus Eremiobacteraeota bacterium]|nr:L,D-transpeptidase family protein [Candidatus Eremiobacteraeota bacterium]